ncbi:MAG: Rrf2 family transcriptional regulator [Gemmatimonadales bacterium]
MISQTAEYALRTVIHIAQSHGNGEMVSAADMARQLSIPSNYLSKTLNALSRAGILTSSRGKHGGFKLAREPHRITLLSVVAPFDAIGQGSQCLLGQAVCSDRNACAAHRRWKAASDGVLSFFRTTTVADLLAGRA